MSTFRKTDFIPQIQTGGREDRKIVIAVDGPAGSGKGTLARRLAERLGYAWLDTGKLYRAVAMAALDLNADLTRWESVAPAVMIVKRNLTPELLANPLLRTETVADAASKIAALPEVRLELLDVQRNFANNPPEDFGGAVLDGRDIGTVVCPDADIKLFITATAEERARRRHRELKNTDDRSYEEILKDVIARDERDTTRDMAPLRAAGDAYILDTTKLDIPEVLEEAIGVIRAKFLEETDIEGQKA